MFVHDTPLAVVAALAHAKPVRHGMTTHRFILRYPPGLHPTGTCDGPVRIYGLWLPFPVELLSRLAESFIAIHGFPPENCRVVRVQPRDIFARLAAVFCRWGWVHAAELLITRCRPEGIDATGRLVDNG